jgi:pyruvate,water dikinase
VRDQTRTQAQAKLGPVHRFAFDRLLHTTTIYMHLRERSSFLISEESFELRRIFLALGDLLVSRQELGHREDVFCLWLDELRQLATGQIEGSVANERIASRRAEMQADGLLDLPDTICGDTVVAYPLEALESQQQLPGISGSSGWAEGQACIVLDPVMAPSRLSERDILVVPFSDVSWTPLFAGIGGIVAETGGQLSHSAIVAREYGLPAVVNVRNATRLIQDGQTIIVDGSRGQVYLR